jgi:hypothetical protein
MPYRRILRQSVFFHDALALEVVDLKGKRSFRIPPTSYVSVGIGQNLKTGALENEETGDKGENRDNNKPSAQKSR